MWNGTMFVDLDWPLNASSLLSASAELLVFTDTSSRIRTRCLIRLPRRIHRLVSVLSGHAYLSRHLNIMRVVAHNPCYCHCQGAYVTSAHFVGECDRYASSSRDIWRKPYLHPHDFQYLIVGELGVLLGIAYGPI